MDTLVNITNLELGANRIRVIENLDTLVNLTQLWLGKNKITKLEVSLKKEILCKDTKPMYPLELGRPQKLKVTQYSK